MAPSTLLLKAVIHQAPVMGQDTVWSHHCPQFPEPGETEGLPCHPSGKRGKDKSWPGCCFALSAALPSLGIQAHESAGPSSKQSGDWLINHGIFMKTRGGRLGGGMGPLTAAARPFLVAKSDALPFPWGSGWWVLGWTPSPSPWSLCHPSASFAKTS